MSFEKPLMLLLLLVLPLLSVLVFKTWTEFNKFLRSPQIYEFLFGSHLPNWKTRWTGIFLSIGAVSLIIVGLARPTCKILDSDKSYRNVNLFFLLDVSKSMIYAEDIKPNRLTAAKKEIMEVYAALGKQYRVCLIPFAGDANVYYCPLTNNSSVFLTMLNRADEETAFATGTDILKLFQNLNKYAKNNKDNLTGVNLAVIISDGGKEEGFPTDIQSLNSLVSELNEKMNFRIYSIGVGTKNPTPLVVRDWGNNFVSYLSDGEKVFRSELDEQILKKIARYGKGTYASYDQSGKLAKIIQEIVIQNRKPDARKVKYVDFQLQPFLFAIAALMLWIAAMLNKSL